MPGSRTTLLAALLVAGPVLAQDADFAARPAVPHVRVMTWNVGSNSIFADPGPGGTKGSDAARPERFRRIVRAVDPDVVCLQEIFEPRGAGDVQRILDDVLPLPTGGWHAYGAQDIVIASRYPVGRGEARREDWGGGKPRTHAIALVDLPASVGDSDLLAVCAHLQSRGEPKDVAARQEQADAMSARLRELKADRDALPPSTPIVVLGDLNAYRTDPARHVATLVDGTIANAQRYGAGTPPDWDRTALADARPLHNAVGPATYTFGDGTTNPHPPGELDRVLYTDSVLGLRGAFVLNTRTLGAATLARLGLEADDVLRFAGENGFDHYPLVVDFELRRHEPVPARPHAAD